MNKVSHGRRDGRDAGTESHPPPLLRELRLLRLLAYHTAARATVRSPLV